MYKVEYELTCYYSNSTYYLYLKRWPMYIKNCTKKQHRNLNSSLKLRPFFKKFNKKCIKNMNNLFIIQTLMQWLYPKFWPPYTKKYYNVKEF